jgi:biopolymer transport protein ExbB/TolQ
MTDTLTIVTLLFVIASMFVIGVLWNAFTRFEKRIGKLEIEAETAKQERLQAQAEKDAREKILLEANNRGKKHHTYNTIAALEDATSVLLDVSLDQEASRARLETALGILQMIRKGPYDYKPQIDKGVNGNG